MTQVNIEDKTTKTKRIPQVGDVFWDKATSRIYVVAEIALDTDPDYYFVLVNPEDGHQYTHPVRDLADIFCGDENDFSYVPTMNITFNLNPLEVL